MSMEFLSSDKNVLKLVAIVALFHEHTKKTLNCILK